MKISYLLFNGFSGLELMFPAFVLRNQEVQTVGLTKGPIISEENMRYYPDITLEELDIDTIDALVIPGGSALQHLKDGSILQKKLEELNNKKKIIAAICGSPVLFANTSLLQERNFTAGYKGDLPEHWQKNFKTGNYKGDEDVVVDENLITSKGIAVVKFATTIANELKLFKNIEEEESTYAMLQNIR